jgi:hypothetical protein
VRVNVPLGENVAAFQQVWRPLNTGSVGRLLARLRHADRIEQCPSLKGKAENICSLRVFRIL